MIPAFEGKAETRLTPIPNRCCVERETFAKVWEEVMWKTLRSFSVRIMEKKGRVHERR